MGGEKDQSLVGATIDYKAIAAKAVRAMNTGEVHHFLIVCSLVSDLYCPGFNPRQALAKASNLAMTAGRYKIDTTKLTAEVRAESEEEIRYRCRERS